MQKSEALKTKALKPEALVAQFLLEQIDPALSASYVTLAGLSYPIPDQKSFLDQLDAPGPNGCEGQAPSLLTHVFDVSDFPLASIQGGLEKFHRQLTVPTVPSFGPFGGFDLPGPRDEPDPAIPEEPFFGTDACGLAAQRVYQRTLDRFGWFPGAARAAYYEARDFAAICRTLMPDYGSALCSGPAARAWAFCFADQYPSRAGLDECAHHAEAARARCADAIRPRPVPLPHPGPTPVPGP